MEHAAYVAEMLSYRQRAVPAEEHQWSALEGTAEFLAVSRQNTEELSSG